MSKHDVKLKPKVKLNKYITFERKIVIVFSNVIFLIFVLRVQIETVLLNTPQHMFLLKNKKI